MKAKFLSHKQESYAFEKYYYELMDYDTPLHFTEPQLLKTMENTGKTMFKVPREHSKLWKDLWFVFDIRHTGLEVIYVFKHVIADDMIIRKFDKDENYIGWEGTQFIKR